uniref:Uncharacterized protein n=1 Tax=Pundamilia nyererei TaxID=303518 RepID=A0A3B4FI49_9CICH
YGIVYSEMKCRFCITNNDLKKLRNLLKNDNIDGVYPCREYNDYITPLIAAIVNHNKEICSYLLCQGADPNIPSEHLWTPLHYVTHSKAPPDFMDLLLKAKANPNGWKFTPLQREKFTPLQLSMTIGEGRNVDQPGNQELHFYAQLSDQYNFCITAAQHHFQSPASLSPHLRY